MEQDLKIIARIYTDFPTKFGIPRQSGLVEELKGCVVFEPEYRQVQAVRGLSDFSHIWLLWGFSQSKKKHWAATVTPPRLGGKKRVGVFATRAPFRPNNIGLSCVRLERIEQTSDLGVVLHVSGIDMVDGTPIYDIKPYIVYTDCHPDAAEGFVSQTKTHLLQVEFPPHLLERLPKQKQEAIIKVLAQDPRPAYDTDEEQIYGVEFAGFDIRFKVHGNVLTVQEAEWLCGGHAPNTKEKEH